MVSSPRMASVLSSAPVINKVMPAFSWAWLIVSFLQISPLKTALPNLCKVCKNLEMRKISVIEKESRYANLCKVCKDLQGVDGPSNFAEKREL